MAALIKLLYKGCDRSDCLGKGHKVNLGGTHDDCLCCGGCQAPGAGDYGGLRSCNSPGFCERICHIGLCGSSQAAVSGDRGC